MAAYDYDLFVIGAGSAGVRAGRMAASYGARVAVAEERYLGGTCVNVGCIPKKLLAYAAHFAEDFEDAVNFGWSVGARRFDWPTLIANKDAEIHRLNDVYGHVLRGAGVRIIDGRARITDPHSVEVGGRSHTAATLLVATGGWPTVPDIPGREHVITSNEAFFLEALPRRVVIVGGGYVAIEFAGIFNGMGAETTLAYRGPLFLRGFDRDVRAHMAQEVAKKGVRLAFNAEVVSVTKAADGLTATLADGTVLAADTILTATGRAPNVEGLGLEAAGVELNLKGAVVVDETYRSSLPSIYAIGDVTDRVQLTPVAIAEGMAVARTLFRGEATSVNYADIPTTVFSQPNFGAVGLTEEHAREACDGVTVYKSAFRALKHTISGRDEQTLMKLIVETATDRVVGVHMVGPDAGEIIQGMAVAMKAGAKKADFDATIGIHPTAAEEFVTMREPVAQARPEAAA